MRIYSKCQIPRRFKDYNIKSRWHKLARWIKTQLSGCDSADITRTCCFVLVIIVIILIIWLCVRDPCDSYKIKQRICQDYSKGLASGYWCYELCIENSISFSRCLSQDQHSTAFLWKDIIVKIQHTSNPSWSSRNKLPYHLTDIDKSLSLEDFINLLINFFHSKLGPDTDQTQFLDQIIKFADFNNDNEIKFEEANSVWELLQSHEFFILFLFQEDSTFPRINGTCGNIYFYDQTGVTQLFDKQHKGFLDHFFSNTYRWQFPSWKKRANIVMGLLEFVGSLIENNNAKFYMCDISATMFGFEKYEARIMSVENIMSHKMLKESLMEQPCFSNSDCVIGKSCMTSCDNQTRTCDTSLIKPNLVSICEIVQDFLIFDTPLDLKPDLVHKLSKCVNLYNESDSSRLSSSSHLNESFLQHNLILSDLKAFIWDQIKEQPSNWLLPKYPRVA